MTKGRSHGRLFLVGFSLQKSLHSVFQSLVFRLQGTRQSVLSVFKWSLGYAFMWLGWVLGQVCVCLLSIGIWTCYYFYLAPGSTPVDFTFFLLGTVWSAARGCLGKRCQVAFMWSVLVSSSFRFLKSSLTFLTRFWCYKGGDKPTLRPNTEICITSICQNVLWNLCEPLQTIYA